MQNQIDAHELTSILSPLSLTLSLSLPLFLSSVTHANIVGQEAISVQGRQFSRHIAKASIVHGGFARAK